MSIEVSTLVGKTRLLAADVDEVDPIFSDAEVQAFLDMSFGSPDRKSVV